METIEKKKHRLPKKFAEKWLKALRSGEYEQANGQLYDDEYLGGSYCCLGVACEVVGHGKVLKEKFGEKGLPIQAKIIGKESCVFTKLPGLLREDFAPLREEDSFVESVAEMNDNGQSFKEIADWIEDNVELY